MEKQIKELELKILQAISDSKLNVSIVELVLRNIYKDVKQLADENLINILKEESENIKEEDKDGESISTES